jgi:hypothetical protein
LEEQIASVWSQVLGLDKVGVNDPFIDLGGHSLLAQQVVVRLRRALPVDIKIKHVLEAETIARLANDVRARLVDKLELMTDEDAQRLLAADES